MSGKRTVATDALDTLGTIINDKQKRDAIHLAVEPVIAGEKLKPGEHITVVEGVAHKTKVGGGLGIVDPFLAKPVMAGERFWFVMYPRMVHSLRHVWEHPSFPEETLVLSFTKAASEKWLRDFFNNGANLPGYETVMEIIDKGSIPSSDPEYYSNGGEINEDYIIIRGTDAGGSIPLEFWDHVENVLGRKVKYRPSYFTCSC